MLNFTVCFVGDSYNLKQGRHLIDWFSKHGIDMVNIHPMNTAAPAAPANAGLRSVSGNCYRDMPTIPNQRGFRSVFDKLFCPWILHRNNISARYVLLLDTDLVFSKDLTPRHFEDIFSNMRDVNKLFAASAVQIGVDKVVKAPNAGVVFYDIEGILKDIYLSDAYKQYIRNMGNTNIPGLEEASMRELYRGRNIALSNSWNCQTMGGYYGTEYFDNAMIQHYNGRCWRLQMFDKLDSLGIDTKE